MKIYTYSLGSTIHPLLCGFTASYLISPFCISYVLSNYGAESYSVVNFSILLAMVVLFVTMLNIQSNMESPVDPVQQRIWRFFRGEGLKRTRSLRKFISSVRGSIKGSQYGRLRRGNAATTPLGPNPVAVKSYRSTQNTNKKHNKWLEARHNTSIDEESTTSCLTPRTLSQAVTPEPPSFSEFDVREEDYVPEIQVEEGIQGI